MGQARRTEIAPSPAPAPPPMDTRPGRGGPTNTRGLPHVGQGQDHHPAPTRRARDKREHRRAYPQDPDGPGRGHAGPQLAPQPAPRRPARQALRQTPAQGTQSQHPRRDRPTRHPHRLPPPRPARHQTVHRLRPRRKVDLCTGLATRHRSQRQRSPGLRGPTGATVPAHSRQAPGRHALFPPGPIQAIQVDGGSEFKADFETECQRRGITLFELPPRSPELNGHVERNNGAWRYEFYATWDLTNDDLDGINRWIDAFADESDTFRPRQALGGQTPAQYLAKHAAEEAPPSHMA